MKPKNEKYKSKLTEFIEKKLNTHKVVFQKKNDGFIIDNVQFTLEGTHVEVLINSKLKHVFFYNNCEQMEFFIKGFQKLYSSN
jgi:hypothetical protein